MKRHLHQHLLFGGKRPVKRSSFATLSDSAYNLAVLGQMVVETLDNL